MLGLGKTFSIKELAVLVQKSVGFKGEIIFFDPTKPEWCS